MQSFVMENIQIVEGLWLDKRCILSTNPVKIVIICFKSQASSSISYFIIMLHNYILKFASGLGEKIKLGRNIDVSKTPRHFFLLQFIDPCCNHSRKGTCQPNVN